MASFALLLVIFIGSGIWFDSMKTKEIALKSARSYCRDHELQLLDDTVSCVKFRIKFANSRLIFFRLYHIAAFDKMRNKRVRIPIYMHNHTVIKVGNDDDKIVKMSDYRS